jgi:putative NADH-flavin reductase
MKVAVIGATGNAGSRLVNELLTRKHEVTGISRHPEKLAVQAGLTMKQGDIRDQAALAQLLAGHEAVIHAVRFLQTDIHSVIAAVKQAGVTRLLVVGGAGSLESSPGVSLVDTPSFPEAVKPESNAGVNFLNALRGEKELEWTFLSPSAIFTPGERMGKFRLGTDQLLTSAGGQSKISMEDFAIAMVDELERPQHTRQRFTVGY